MKTKPRIAILGAGIMGSSLALYLARKGADVTLFDKAVEPFSAASRWNEGKIHMGYIYAADKSMQSAQKVLTGGLKFQSLVEELLGSSIEHVVTQHDDIYLCHRNSVVSPKAMELYMNKVTELLNAQSDLDQYFADSSSRQVVPLTDSELMEISGSNDIIAGFRVPEYSVQTTWIADRFVEAIYAQKHIKLQMGTLIKSVMPSDENNDDLWDIHTSSGVFGSYDYVINALWEGRMAIDQTVGLEPSGVWSNRFRQSLFVRTAKPINTPSTIIATGPFGDIKNYNGRDFYLSWYPDGLRADSTDIVPPDLDSIYMPSQEFLSNSIFDHLQTYLPWVQRIRENAEQIRLKGGWVFAAGRGKLSDPSSSLHQRYDYGIIRHGTYISIDTGKYSTAPFMAKSLADTLIPD